MNISSAFAPNHAEGVCICAKRNIIDAHSLANDSITSFAEGNFIYANGVTSFICAARGGNDVLAFLEMMLRALHANDVVPCGTNEKIQVLRLGFFVLPLQNRSMQGYRTKTVHDFAVRIHLSLGDDGSCT